MISMVSSVLMQGQKVLVFAPDHTHQLLETTVHKYKECIGNGEIIVAHHAQLVNLSASSFDVVISFATNKDNHSDIVLATVLKLLKPKGTALFFEPCAHEANISSVRTPQQLAQRMTLFGFVDTVVLQATPETRQQVLQLLPANITPEQRDKLLVVEITTHKPQWEIGATAKLNFNKKPNSTSVETKPIIKADKQAWLASDDLDDELINEDDLLSEVDPIDLNVPGPSGCGTETKKGRKKACKNCSCGLAEQTTKVTLNLTDTNALPKSSCGSCYLGDAFRCPACPYMGLPAFKPGEKIQITTSLMVDDI
jgi:ubiquinone/menaquinone biosynthesis C-methylase UbiE